MFDLKIIKNSFNTNKWFTTLGSRVTEVLTRSGLLISEDITFIDTLIDSESDFLSNKDCLQTKSEYFNKNVLIIFSITSGLMWFESSLTSYRPLFGSIICGLSYKLSSVLYNFIHQIYINRRLIEKSIDLSQRLNKERDLIKKYFNLIEDYEVIEDNGKHLMRISEMKDKFRNICWNCFKNFREITINLRINFPMNSEIDEEMNYLCCFPIETFEKFISEDKNDITLSMLKSLMHLKRLQQSECFRRIICLFLTICLDKPINNQTTDQYIKNVSKNIFKIFDNLIEESKGTYPELLSAYNCAKSLWISSEKSLIKYRDLKQTNATIETTNLLNTNRSIRKHLLTSFNLLDDCDSLIEDGIHSNQFKNEFRHKLDSISAEFKSLNDLINNLEKILRIEELRELNSKSSIKCEELNQNTESSTVVPKIEDYVVKDQVFEAIVTEEYDDNDINLDLNNDQLWEMRLKLAQESDASNSLFKELKVALKSKAIEHKRREAKALGIDFDETNIESNRESEIEKNNEFCEKSNEKTLIYSKENQNNKNTNISIKALNEEKLLFRPNSFGFESQMASIAAQKALLFASSKEIENFGDDPDSDTNEEDYPPN